MAGINPAEVSDILKKQLQGISTEAEFQEIGTVIEVGDGIARIFGLEGVKYNEMIEFTGEI